jgi:hypothetical protein
VLATKSAISKCQNNSESNYKSVPSDLKPPEYRDGESHGVYGEGFYSQSLKRNFNHKKLLNIYSSYTWILNIKLYKVNRKTVNFTGFKNIQQNPYTLFNKIKKKE